MSTRRRPDRPLHLIREPGDPETSSTAHDLAPARQRLRARIDKASKRPAPGTSNLLHGSLSDVVVAGKHFEGAYDATGLLPVHLRNRGLR